MNIFLNDITSRFGISNPENLQMFVKWISLSPSQKYFQKSELMSAPNGIQLDVGQFAYVTLKSGSGKHVFSAYIFVDSATSFRQTSFYRITLTHYLMFGKNCKDKVSDVFQAYQKADETASKEESLPRQQRLENLAKRSCSYEKFLGLAKAHDVINGRNPKQVEEIKRFWDEWSGNQHAQQQQAPQAMSAPAQSPFAMQQPAQIVSAPLQSPFAAQRPVQAPMAPQMTPQASQMQVPQAMLQAIYNLLQPLLAANMAQASAKAP